MGNFSLRRAGGKNKFAQFRAGGFGNAWRRYFTAFNNFWNCADFPADYYLSAPKNFKKAQAILKIFPI